MKAFVAVVGAGITMPRRTAVTLLAGLGLALLSLVVCGWIFDGKSIIAPIMGRAAPIQLSEQALDVHTVRLIDWLVPGMLGMLLMWANLSIGALLGQWRQRGIMKRVTAEPLEPGVLIAAQTLARLMLSLALGAGLIVIAMPVFKVRVLGSWGILLLAMTVGAVSMMALGFVIGSFMRTPETAQAVTLLVSLLMLFLGGSYVPTDRAPAFLTPVIKAMPLSYLNDALRQVINNGANLAGIQTDLMILVAWLVAALLLSTRVFRWS